MQISRQIRNPETPDLPQDGQTPVDVCQIPLTRGFVAIVDADLYEELNRYRWKAVKSKSCWYAARKFTKNGRTHYIRMHRQIMNTPPGEETHHKDFNTMHNWRANMENLTPAIHHHRHLQRHFLEI